MDFLDCCRLCRTSSSDSNLLHLTSSINGIEISEILTQTIPIDFNDEISSKLPQKVCHKCFDIFVSAYELQKIAIESDRFYRASVTSQDQISVVKCESSEIYLNEFDVGNDQEVDSEYLGDDKMTKNYHFTPRPIKKSSSYFFACTFCDFKLKPKAKVIHHMRRKHDPFLFPYHCNFCVIRFKDKTSKLTHEKNHSKKRLKIIICEICNVTGLNEDGMNYHKSVDHGLKSEFLEDVEVSSERCNFCDKKFKTRSNLLTHLRLHDLFTCEKFSCMERFDDEIKLERHLKNDHDDENCFECDYCGATCFSKTLMKKHFADDHVKKSSRIRNTKITDNSQKCHECDENFDNEKDLEFHVMAAHEILCRKLKPDEIKINLQCCKCEESQETAERVIEHSKIHKDNFGKFKCKFCKHQLKSFDEFIEHSKYHLQPPTHKCLSQKCKRDFSYDEIFLNHLRYHKNQERCGRKVECEKCGKKLKSQKELVNHDRIRHKKEILFICPMCAKSMSSKNALDQHLRFIHNKEEALKFQCKYCPTKCVSKNKLTRHEATHSTDRPHVCEICAMTFKHDDGLKMHLKRHNGTLPKNHACGQCKLRFNTKHRLEQHMLTHTGLKPHECKFCDRAYASKGDLTKHMQKLHVGDSIYQCEKCPRAFRLIVELREHLSEHSV